MAADDKRDARGFLDELTPLPIELSTSMTPLEAELQVAQAANRSLQLEMAAHQATLDELRGALREARDDRRTLARRCETQDAKIKALEQELAAKKGTP